MDDSDKKSKLPPGVVPKIQGASLGSDPASLEPEVDSARTVIASENQELKAWRESLRPHLGGQRPATLASGVDTLRNRESFRPGVTPRPLPRDVSETVAIQDIARVSQKKQATKSLLPMRTWALLGVTVVVAVYVFLLDDAGQSPTTSSPPQPVATQATPSPPAASAKVPATRAEAPKPAVAIAAKRAEPSPVLDEDDESQDKDGSRSDVDREIITDVIEARAAAYWIQGDTLKALPLYKRLAQQQPEQPVYRLVVDILRRQMVETCQAGQDPC